MSETLGSLIREKWTRSPAQIHLFHLHLSKRKRIQTSDFKGRRDSHDGVDLEVSPLLHAQRAVVVFVLAPPRMATGQTQDGNYRISSLPQVANRLIRLLGNSKFASGCQRVNERCVWGLFGVYSWDRLQLATRP